MLQHCWLQLGLKFRLCPQVDKLSLETTRLCLESYCAIVCANLQDSVPKVHCSFSLNNFLHISCIKHAEPRSHTVCCTILLAPTHRGHDNGTLHGESPTHAALHGFDMTQERRVHASTLANRVVCCKYNTHEPNCKRDMCKP